MHALADRHIQFWFVAVLLFCGAAVGTLAGLYFFGESAVYDYTVKLEAPDGHTAELQRGIWPELANANFFDAVRAQFISERAHFVEADLTTMTLRVYRGGVLALTVPIKSKGREGSWWETPAGLYNAQAKEPNHFSSFGHVYMPYSIPFQGNFFIHGWPYYEDGTPVAEGYSGGCIRLEDEHAVQVYDLVEVGMPILVYEDETERANFTYVLEAPELTAASFLVADLDNHFLLLAANNDRESSTDLVARLMAAVVASEYMNIERTVTINARMLEGTTEGRLAKGAAYRLYDLLYPLLREGSAEAAQAIAGHFGARRFQGLMQAKAEALGMRHTAFGRIEGGAWNGNTTTAEDVFLFMKYLVENRSFILTMTTNIDDTRIYGEPVFAGVRSLHPLAQNTRYRGGAADARSSWHAGNAAAVALVFASSSSAVAGSDDLITLVELPFGGSMRNVLFVAFDARNAAADTNAMISFVERMYH